jgi:hypothetical protein
LVCFYNEKVDTYIDGVLEEKWNVLEGWLGWSLKCGFEKQCSGNEGQSALCWNDLCTLENGAGRRVVVSLQYYLQSQLNNSLFPQF